MTTPGPSPSTKKPSFSFKNAFKSSKSTAEPPPVPQIDPGYPFLRNAFNRSTSSLANHPTNPGRRPSATPAPQKAQTTPSTDSRFPRGTARSKSYAYGRTQHARSGSLFHSSDTGSEGHGSLTMTSMSPPPVPKVPGGFGSFAQRTDSPLPMNDYEDKIVMDPRTPSDFALHAVFMRFATSAESKIDVFLRQTLVSILVYVPQLSLICWLGYGTFIADIHGSRGGSQV